MILQVFIISYDKICLIPIISSIFIKIHNNSLVYKQICVKVTTPGNSSSYGI